MNRYVLATLLLNVAASGPAAEAQVQYTIDDGVAETALAIDPGEDLVWFNTFPTLPAGNIIQRVQLTYGRPGGPSSLNGLPISVLIYDDATGGAPTDAVLRHRADTTIANANTSTLNEVLIPDVSIAGTLVLGVYFHNSSGVLKAVGPIDRTAPSFAGRSYLGFNASIDPANLGAIPTANFGTTESFNLAGNFVLRAVAVPSPASATLVALVGFTWFSRRR